MACAGNFLILQQGANLSVIATGLTTNLKEIAGWLRSIVLFPGYIVVHPNRRFIVSLPSHSRRQ